MGEAVELQAEVVSVEELYHQEAWEELSTAVEVL